MAKFTHTAGMPRTTPKGRPVAGTYRESYCCFCFRMKEALQPTLMQVVDFLQRRRATVQTLVAEGGRISCAVDASGAHEPVLIAAEVLRSCAELSVAIELSTYRVLQEGWEVYENQLTEA